MKKYLKGFANFGFTRITENTDESYTAETRSKLVSAVSCTPTDNRTEFSIPADDGIWDEGSDWTDTTLEVAFVEAELKLMAEMTGADFSETDSELSESSLDVAPEIAITFSALRADGGYRLFRYYACKCTNIKITHNTKGSNNNNDQYTVTFKATPRKCDKKIRSTKDINKGELLTWLDTIPSFPAANEG